MGWLCLLTIVIFIIICFWFFRQNTTRHNEEQKRREEFRKNRITSKPACPRNDSKKEIVNNRSAFITTDKILSENLDNKTKSDYQSFSSGLKSPLDKIKQEDQISYIAYFKDNWGKGIVDYSHMSPEEAKWELKCRKKDEGYIPWEEYGGLLDAIAAEKDDKYSDVIQGKTPKEVEKWFHKNIRNDVRMSSFIWQEVGKILALIHESTLLSGMEHCSVRSIESYVKNRKREGYFFTQKAYDLANRIYSGEYDPVAIRARENSSTRAKLNAPEKALKEKIRRTKKNIEQAVSNNDTAKIEKYQAILEQCEKDLEEMLSKK